MMRDKTNVFAFAAWMGHLGFLLFTLAAAWKTWLYREDMSFDHDDAISAIFFTELYIHLLLLVAAIGAGLLLMKPLINGSKWPMAINALLAYLIHFSVLHMSQEPEGGISFFAIFFGFYFFSFAMFWEKIFGPPETKVQLEVESN